MTMTVLVLESLASQGGASSSAADQEPAAAHIARCPNQVADALESEHRVVNKKRDRIDPVIGIGSPGGDKRAHRSGFGNALFKDLTVFRFLVIKQRRHVDRFIELAYAGINSYLAETGPPCRRCALRRE